MFTKKFQTTGEKQIVKKHFYGLYKQSTRNILLLTFLITLFAGGCKKEIMIVNPAISTWSASLRLVILQKNNSMSVLMAKHHSLISLHLINTPLVYSKLYIKPSSLMIPLFWLQVALSFRKMLLTLQ